MKGTKGIPRNNLAPALEAIADLLQQEMDEIHHRGLMAGQMAHSEIEHAPINQKSGVFYRHFVPLRNNWVSLLALSYRRYFRLALAHPAQTGRDPRRWALDQLYPAVGVAFAWIRDWYILACDGENQYVQRIGTVPFAPGQTVSIPIPLTSPPSPSPESWRAPAWLFAVSIALVGVGRLKTEHVPATDSEQRLGAAHTRLLLKGARRVFLWELSAEFNTVRNEEIAAAGALPEETIDADRESDKQKRSKRPLRGLEGLGPKKADLSQYMHNLTERQRLAVSLKYEYELGLAEIASRMGVDRKTAYEHIEAAQRRINQVRTKEKGKKPPHE